MAATSYRYLVNLPGVYQRKTVTEGTRIGVHDVIGLLVNGASIEGVCRSFPDLSRAQVHECPAYYEDHRTEIDALIAEQMSAIRAAGMALRTARAKRRAARFFGNAVASRAKAITRPRKFV